ncbi:bZIP transcription factor domain-containing protein [Purpureocillium lavendulum]|uniref:BZIP transcription factor domain-containing protein n=1 Tax=Purpureocillium lavendulum TaxID=1247861 RepID=A0AB34FIR4_9HYPO|nr:bZIP transcription factor domain-containing protein [Purpureocillium lavendulum]
MQTTAASTSASAVRIRENQRRSRARRKEYVEGLERKVHDYEKNRVEATLEMQTAARTVALENSRLRAMLARMGASDADVEAFLQSSQEHDAARALESVRWQGQADHQRRQQQPDDVKVEAKHDDDGCSSRGSPPCGPAQLSAAQGTASHDHKHSAGATHYALPRWGAQGATPFDKLDVLASASVQQGCCDGRTQCVMPASSANSRANSPSTAGPSPGAVTPSSSDQAFGSPMEMSCNAAAQIIAEMQGYSADRDITREKLGCNGQSDCLVKNTDGNLDEWSHRRGERLLAVGTKRRDGHGDGELEVVAGRGEALRAPQAVPEAEPAGDPERDEEDDDEVHDQRGTHPHDGHDLAHDVLALRGKQDDDGVEEPNQRPRGGEAHKDTLVPVRTGDFAQPEAGNHSGPQGNAEEDADAGGHDSVGQAVDVVVVADDADEEYGQGREQDHLQDRVDGHEDGAVLCVAARQPVPDEDHGDTAGEAHEDEAGAQVGLVGEEGPREGQLRLLFWRRMMCSDSYRTLQRMGYIMTSKPTAAERNSPIGTETPTKVPFCSALSVLGAKLPMMMPTAMARKIQTARYRSSHPRDLNADAFMAPGLQDAPPSTGVVVCSVCGCCCCCFSASASLLPSPLPLLETMAAAAEVVVSAIMKLSSGPGRVNL